MICFIVVIFENYKIHSYVEAWDYQIPKRQITKKIVANGHAIGGYANNYELSLSGSRIQKHTHKMG